MNITTELRRRPLGDSAMLAEADIEPLLKRLYVQRGVCEVGELERGARVAPLILTVDNGISSYAGVTLAPEKGIPVLITDHHLPGDSLPVAATIVNPNLRDCTFASKSLAGVGMAFYLMLALRARLNDSVLFTHQGIAASKLAELLDLMALGPRLNAAGRLYDMSVGVALLLSEDLPQVRMLGGELDAFNQTRREIEQGMEAEGLALCQSMVRAE